MFFEKRSIAHPEEMFVVFCRIKTKVVQVSLHYEVTMRFCISNCPIMATDVWKTCITFFAPLLTFGL